MKRAVFLLLALLLSGCAGRGLSGSFCGPLPSDTAVVQVAQDAVSFLASSYPPGHTALFLMPAKAENAFAPCSGKRLAVTGVHTFNGRPKRRPGRGLHAGRAAGRCRVVSATETFRRARRWARVYDAAGLPEAGRSQTGSRGASSFTGKSREQGRAAYDKAAHALND